MLEGERGGVGEGEGEGGTFFLLYFRVARYMLSMVLGTLTGREYAN